MGSSKGSDDDFSVMVLASDLGVDARPFLSPEDREGDPVEPDNWQDCPCYFANEDFSDLEARQFFRRQGFYKSGNRIIRIIGKFFTAPVASAECLNKYIFYKSCTELPEGPFCIVYLHSAVQKEDNSPGMTIMRWIYEDLPAEIKDRLQVYFVHPELRSRLALATLGRFFLSGNCIGK